MGIDKKRGKPGRPKHDVSDSVFAWVSLRLTGGKTVTQVALPGLEIFANADDPNAKRLDEIADFLKLQRDARGRLLQVVRIPSPGRIEDEDGEIAPASHMNFLIGNSTVVVPTYGTPTASKVVEALKPFFPGRNVIGLPSRYILTGGGSFHCITQQQPA